jgi:hypothetical protein
VISHKQDCAFTQASGELWSLGRRSCCTLWNDVGFGFYAQESATAKYAVIKREMKREEKKRSRNTGQNPKRTYANRRVASKIPKRSRGINERSFGRLN